jgi:hypothetical protein
MPNYFHIFFSRELVYARGLLFSAAAIGFAKPVWIYSTIGGEEWQSRGLKKIHLSGK